MNECIHELPVDQCVDCKPKTGPVWDLQWEAVCPTCWLRMDPGTKVRWTADGTQPQHARH